MPLPRAAYEPLPRMFEKDGSGEDVPVVDRYSDGAFGASRPHLGSAPDVQLPHDIHADFDLCRRCEAFLPRCQCPSLPHRSKKRLLAPVHGPASRDPQQQRRKKSNAGTRQGNKMESSTDAGTLAVSAAPQSILPDDPFLFSGGVALADGQQTAGGDALPGLAEQEQSNYVAPETPHPNGKAPQISAQNSRPDTPNTERVANILANGPIHAQEGQAGALNMSVNDPNLALAGLPTSNMQGPTRDHDGDGWSFDDDTAFDSQNAQGFAKLMFPDGDYIVTTHDVEIGRNMEIAAHYKREQKMRKREQQREQRRERVPPAQKDLAQRDLEMYQAEPSQPSMAGDDPQYADASNSSRSLEGRPAPQSTFSETGGALAFARDSDDEAEGRRGRKKRRSMPYSKSSTSTTSVVPANLHPHIMTAEYSQQELFTDAGEPYSRTLATLPIHTQRPEDITKLSKRHLLFSFNFQEERWELQITGNNAFVNDEFVSRGSIIPLSHNDEIQIATVTITFKLPDSHRHSPGLSRGTFSQIGIEDREDFSGDERTTGTSPVRRLSNAFEGASSDDDQATKKRGIPKLKLKGLKKPQKDKKTGAKQPAEDDEKAAPKISLKKQQRRRSDEEQSPEIEKKAEKGKKPKEAAKQPAEPPKSAESIEGPPAPPVWTAEPGSALASVPVDELPQKRKGPGRPPKNGLVSKRDQALVRKKERDYEKAGQPVPPFNRLLDIVRAETKQKEMLAKMQSGALPPNTEMPPPVETEFSPAAVKAPAAPTPSEGAEQTPSVPPDPTRRPSSPRPKRVARSPSPMKPESAYTEDDLKKPSATYVHILDEILREHPTGQADLQELYDRIQKRYPFFKYRVNTQGWQSSVRHNLLSATRFKETGRSGKGKLWTIDYDVPLEKEKKKKPTPPPRPVPMVNGQYVGYGQQQQFGNGYAGPANGQRAVNGGPGYYSPYGQGHSNQHTAGAQVSGQQGVAGVGAAQPNGAQQQQQSDPFGGLVPEILALRSEFLSPYANAPNMQAKSDWIGKCIMIFSNRFHGSSERPELSVETPEEKKAYSDLDAIFQKYETLKAKQKQEQEQQQLQQEQQQGMPSAPPAQTGANPHPAANGVSQHTSTGQTAVLQPAPMQSQTVQTAVADGVAYQSAKSVVSPPAPQASAAQGNGIPSGTAQPPTAYDAGNGGYNMSPSQMSAPPTNTPSAAHTPAPTASMPYYTLSNGSQQASASNRQPTALPTNGSAVGAQPFHQGSHIQPPQQGDARAMPPAQAPVQQHSAEGAGTKRAAEDDAMTPETDAKRAKVENPTEVPPAQSRTGGAATKRPAEDDAAAPENEAKRVKTEA